MANLLYKDRFIVNFARFDETTAFWIPMVDVNWGTNGLRESHTITGPLVQFKNWQDAERFMTEMAKAWIDDNP
ncbi:MAG TPA: hypothetical protein VJ646_14320 [Candidatus Binatia bacterium]|nr:hypothetical protein [Candidatus Binatia bacterium]